MNYEKLYEMPFTLTMARSARSVLVDRILCDVTIYLLCQSVPLSFGLLKLPSYPDALLMLGSVQAAEGMRVVR